MKIYVDKLPESCKKCTFNEWVGDPAELYCSRLGDPVSRETIDDNCPLIELKPKELEWVLLNVSGIYSALHGKYTISVSRKYETQPVYYCCYFLGVHLDNTDSLNSAKKFCQDHCNRLFAKLIGG